MEVFGVLELVLPLDEKLLGDNLLEKPEAELIADQLALAGHMPGDGTMRFRFCPKAAKTYEFEIRSNLPDFNGKRGGITSVAPSPALAQNPAPELPHWWNDNPAPELAEREHHGAKSVSRWREDFLNDFAKRMLRCK